MVRVKICGLMSPEDALMAEEAGADALGFVTEYPVPVPWNLTRERAAELAAGVGPFVATVAVVGGPVPEVVAIARAVRPRVLQLHGDETVDEVNEVCRALEGTGIRVIKALRIEVKTGLARFPEPDPARAAAALAATGIAALVVDSRTASRPAGTGVPLDWSMAARMQKALRIPLILAGGLDPVNVAEAVAEVKPYAVDVISGVESSPGVKNMERVAAFVRAAKRAG